MRDDRTEADFSADFDPHSAVVTVTGCVDGRTAGALADCIGSAAVVTGSARTVLVDLSRVDFLAAGATRHLERAIARARAIGVEVVLTTRRGCIAERVVTTVRDLLADGRTRLPLRRPEGV